MFKEINKEYIKERQNKRCNCECGNSYNYNNKSQHIKTLKHCKLIESKNTKPEVDEV